MVYYLSTLEIMMEKWLLRKWHLQPYTWKILSGGDLKPKKLKSKTGPDPYDHVTSSNLKTEVAPNNDGYKDNLVISVKRQPESTELSMKSKLLGTEKVEMHAKKRKLIE